MASQVTKLKAFNAWYQANKNGLTPEMRQRIEAALKSSTVGDIGDIGDMWSNLRDKVLGTVKESVKALADKSMATITEAAKNAPALAKGAAEYKIVRENIKRLDEGKPLINVTEVGGFSDVRNMVMIGGGALLLFMLMRGKK